MSFSTSFKLYKKDENSKTESTIFDLIDGERETKQTKGLAYIFMKFPELIDNLIKTHFIHKKIKNLLGKGYKNFKNCDFVRVDAEMLAAGNSLIRRDITLTFYEYGIKKLIIVIEAKSISKVNVSRNVIAQLKQYLDPVNYPGDNDVPRIGIILTSHRILIDDLNNDFINITWLDIISILHKYINLKNHELIKEYYNFITGVNSGMNFFEVEVLSVPAGDTFDIIQSYNIHACPDSYSYKTPLFITFRNKGGGEMKKLYKIKDIIVFDPTNTSYVDNLKENNLNYFDRLMGYLVERKNTYGFNHEREYYRFYILSETEQIELNHGPKPNKANNSGARYYSLSEILSGKKFIDVI